MESGDRGAGNADAVLALAVGRRKKGDEKRGYEDVEWAKNEEHVGVDV